MAGEATVPVMTDEMPDAAALRALLDERAIIQLMHEYAHAMDYGDEAAWVDVFTPDAVFDVIESVGGQRIHREEGHGDLAAYVAAYPKPPAFRKHIIVDPVVESTATRRGSSRTGSCCTASRPTACPCSPRSASRATGW